jgi:hypothetical protein
MGIRGVLGVLIVLVLGGCATTYQPLTAMSITGGVKAKQIEGDVYRVLFSGNGYTSRETAQTYWLYQCATLALDKGFPAFEILSDINLTMKVSPEVFFADGKARTEPVSGVVYIPIYTDDSNKPAIEADIRLLKPPFSEAPPKVFDAAKLKSVLAPIVEGKKCSMGNVCEHVHKYLFPEGKFGESST